MREIYHTPDDEDNYNESRNQASGLYSRASLEALAAVLPESKTAGAAKRTGRPTLVGDNHHEQSFKAHFQVNSNMLAKTKDSVESFLNKRIELLNRSREASTNVTNMYFSPQKALNQALT